jgi:lipoprotein-anchoring transpeptidase ErfK/SrfK
MPITGVQAGLPGRTRLAIHGTNAESSIGSAASSGCVRARSADMRWLVNHITAGTVLRIQA